MNRKLAAGIVILLLVCVAVVYILIPSKIVITTRVVVKCNVNGAARVLSKGDVWDSIGGEVGGGEYRIGVRGQGFHEYGLGLFASGDSATGRISLLNVGSFDSVGLQWQCDYSTGVLPVSRLGGYFRAKRILHAMDSVSLRLKSWLENTKNVYGIAMVDSMSGISTILVIRKRTVMYPGVGDIYERVHILRAYAAAHGARETDHPMLHVSGNADSGYESMVGLPVDRVLTGTAQIEPKRYVPWKVVTGKVIGGPWQAERGMELLQQYVTDHQKPAMGLPFQSMVTERDREPDTTKWVTWVVQAVP